MISSPVVSIVMAAFNEEKYIHESIESILKQTFTDFELIIVNDGSTDKTEQIIQSFSDSRIKYIKNDKNIKLIASLNKGLSHTTGKFIARMDADDICYPDRLEKQIRFMNLHPEIGISGSQLEVFGDQTGSMNYPLTHEDIQLRLLITSCFGNNVVVFRRDVLEKYNLYFPEGYLHAEDYKCWTNWIKHTQLANLNEQLVKYRSHPGSVSVKNRNAQRETRDRIRKEYLTELFELKSMEHIASGFFGKLSANRIHAAKFILDRNKALNKVQEEKLIITINDLWYSDALERIESKLSVFFTFPYVFKLRRAGNFKRWINLLKHYIIIRTVQSKGAI